LVSFWVLNSDNVAENEPDCGYWCGWSNGEAYWGFTCNTTTYTGLLCFTLQCFNWQYQACWCWYRCRSSWFGFGYCLSWLASLFFSFFFCFPFFLFVPWSGLCFMWCHWYCNFHVAWKVTLLESMNKRCDFLEHAISVTGLSNVEVVRGRAEVLLVVFWVWILICFLVWIITFLV